MNILIFEIIVLLISVKCTKLKMSLSVIKNGKISIPKYPNICNALYLSFRLKKKHK